MTWLIKYDYESEFGTRGIFLISQWVLWLTIYVLHLKSGNNKIMKAVTLKLTIIRVCSSLVVGQFGKKEYDELWYNNFVFMVANNALLMQLLINLLINHRRAFFSTLFTIIYIACGNVITNC